MFYDEERFKNNSEIKKRTSVHWVPLFSVGFIDQNRPFIVFLGVWQNDPSHSLCETAKDFHTSLRDWRETPQSVLLLLLFLTLWINIKPLQNVLVHVSLGFLWEINAWGSGLYSAEVWDVVSRPSNSWVSAKGGLDPQVTAFTAGWMFYKELWLPLVVIPGSSNTTSVMHDSRYVTNKR